MPLLAIPLGAAALVYFLTRESAHPTQNPTTLEVASHPGRAASNPHALNAALYSQLAFRQPKPIPRNSVGGPVRVTIDHGVGNDPYAFCEDENGYIATDGDGANGWWV